MAGRYAAPHPRVVITPVDKTDFARLANSSPAKRNKSGNQRGDESNCELGHFFGSMWGDVSKHDLRCSVLEGLIYYRLHHAR
jgi:hypothetical protein